MYFNINLGELLSMESIAVRKSRRIFKQFLNKNFSFQRSGEKKIQK